MRAGLRVFSLVFLRPLDLPFRAAFPAPHCSTALAIAAGSGALTPVRISSISPRLPKPQRRIDARHQGGQPVVIGLHDLTDKPAGPAERGRTSTASAMQQPVQAICFATSEPTEILPMLVTTMAG
jgi:hypothetical protein